MARKQAPDVTKDDNPAGLPPAVIPSKPVTEDQEQVILQALSGYRFEAEQARRSG
jgi:hypothetical protein